MDAKNRLKSQNPASLLLSEAYPREPGVYLMKDRSGDVLYVGKAKNIQARLQQYLQDPRPTIPYLLEKVVVIDTIVVNTEKEALILENRLIKKHQPRYNMLLKDGASFVSLEIEMKHPFPMLRMVHTVTPGSLCFGPYTNTVAAKRTLETIHRLFPLRQCSDHDFAARKRPCILHGMGLCLAPCVRLCSVEEYRSLIDKVVGFLKGESEVIHTLHEQMKQYTADLEYEKAKQIYDLIQQIKTTLEKQHVQKYAGIVADVIGYYEAERFYVITILQYDQGSLVNKTDWIFPLGAQTKEDLLTSFMLQHYQYDAPPHIVIPFACDHTLVEEILQEKHPVKIILPKKGTFKRYVELACKNAETLGKQKTGRVPVALLGEMQDRLSLHQYPSHIECFDVSHFSGSAPTAAMVVFYEGVKSSKDSRHYHLDPKIISDDYSALSEVLRRRLSHQENLPDLMIMDGGAGHLSTALEVLASYNVTGVDVIAISKEGSKHTKGLLKEKIHTSHGPIVCACEDPLLFAIQNMRDIAHTWAISLQKKRRSKAITSQLEQVPGIGAIKQKRLLTTFKSLSRVLQASDEDLLQVPGITKNNVQAIRHWFSQNS